MTIDNGEIQGILGLRNVGKHRILLGGTAGFTFKKLLMPVLFDKQVNIVDQFPSVFKFLGYEAFSNHHVRCHNNKEKLMKMLA